MLSTDDNSVNDKSSKKSKSSKKKGKVEKKEVDVNDLKKELDIVNYQMFNRFKKSLICYLFRMIIKLQLKNFVVDIIQILKQLISSDFTRKIENKIKFVFQRV